LNGPVSGLRIRRLLILLPNDSLVSPKNRGSTFSNESENSVLVTLVNGDDIPETPEIKQVACHKKNADLGTKPVYYSNEIFIEQEDARTFKPDEEVIPF
jgi:hypothetical protein